jgi:hypothetical protein
VVFLGEQGQQADPGSKGTNIIRQVHRW